MGSLFLGTLLFSFISAVARRSKKSVQAPKIVPRQIRDEIATLSSQQTPVQVKAINRQQLRKIYNEQKEAVSQRLQVPSHLPYIVTRTTVLGNYLDEKDWQDLAEEKLTDAELLQRVEAKYDHEVHRSIERAAQRVGFINIRRQIRSGSQQVASFSDNQGHGVRIAISHGQSESQIGLDLVGYRDGNCQSKRDELLSALADEGITLGNMRSEDHFDPDGFQPVRQKPLQQDWQKVRRGQQRRRQGQ